jgi:hypothetical protein
VTSTVAEARNRKRAAEAGKGKPQDDSQLSLFGDKDGDNNG